MIVRPLSTIVAILCAISASLAWAVAPSADEMAESRRWAATQFESIQENQALGAGQLAYSNTPFFSFIYDGKPSAELLKTWNCKRVRRELDGKRTEYTMTYSDANTGLVLRCVGIEYKDFPAVEWTLYFKNTSDKDTPILESIQGIDLTANLSTEGTYVLRGIRGDDCSANSYHPYEYTLGPNTNRKFAAEGGRPTNSGGFPYHNLAFPGGGVILAVGWPGQWASSFTRDAGNGLRVAAGQELTHLRLKPGEEIRSPLVAMLFWKGTDPVRAQNLWRRWMLADNLPRPGGKQVAPLLWFCSFAYVDNGSKYTETGEEQFIGILAKEGIRLDLWWIDAGWYPCKSWDQVGTWEPDPKRFPSGFKPISDRVHANGSKLIVWFEPERVTGGSWLAKNHPEWILGGALLNLGNAEARTWLTNHIDQLLTEQGIDHYRQDFNIDPLAYWRANDAADRQGITENLHVQGYLAYWDELRRRHPDMLIDSCSSGGRRNDLETLRRAVPLLRSDLQPFDGNPTSALGNQCQTHGLSSWIPYYGQGVYYNPDHFTYLARSYMCPAYCLTADVRKNDMDWNLFRRLADQWRQVADCFLGDYYPLMPHSLATNEWIAWQFNCPESGKGLVQAFRRDASLYESIRVKLQQLDPNAVYVVTDCDASGSTEATGRELMDNGLAIAIQDRPGAVVISYQKKP